MGSAAELEELARHTRITGTLSILDSDLSTLDARSCLTSTGGDLRIAGNDTLADLAGLRSLTEVGGRLVIEGDPALTSLGDLAAVTAVGGDLEIRDSDALVSLYGLHNMSAIGGDLRLADNAALRDLLFLQALSALGGDLEVRDNPILPTCEAEELRDRLAAAGWTGSAAIAGNDDTVDCPCAGGGAWIGDAMIDSADDLAALAGYRTVTGNLTIRAEDLADLSGLSCVTSVQGHVDLRGTLGSLTGLERLQRVGGGLAITANVPSLAPLVGLTEVGVGADIDLGPWPEFPPPEADDSLYLFGTPDLASLDGLQGLTRLPGDVRLLSSGVTDLTGLDNLASVDGNLELFGNQSLVTLRGLDRLARLGGSLLVDYHSELADLDGLDGLSTIEGDLQLDHNETLASLAGLRSLTHLGGFLGITDNPAVPTCEAERLLERLRAGGYLGDAWIEGTDDDGACDCPELVLEGDATIDSFADLADLAEYTRITGTLSIAGYATNVLDGLPCLQTIDGDLEVTDNPTLARLDGLNSLVRVGGRLVLAASPGLTLAPGLDRITTVTGDLTIQGGDRLRSLVDLRSLTAVGGALTIEGNAGLRYLAGLEALASLGGDLQIEGNESLPTCAAEALRARLAQGGWSGSATIAGNDDSATCGDCDGGALVGDQTIETSADLAALEGVQVIFGGLDVYTADGETLADLAALSCLVEVSGDLRILGNDNEFPPYLEGGPTDLRGLDALFRVGGRLWIESIYHLETLQGLEGLEETGGPLWINGNKSLVGLDGLEGLQRVGWPPGGDQYFAALEIGFNPNLENLAGLASLTHLDGDIFVADNHTLPTCEIELLRERLLAEGWDGEVNAHSNNDHGLCDCPEQVHAGDLTIASAADLEDLWDVTTITGTLAVAGSDLTEITGLSCLRTVEGDLVLDQNASLRRLDGLDGLDTLGGDLTATANPALPTCAAEALRDRLAAAGWSGTATISGNDDSASCEGCPTRIWDGPAMVSSRAELQAMAGYTRITENLSINRLEGVVDLQGLECLEIVDGPLSVDSTIALESLEGLHNLREVNGEVLDILRNARLQSLDGLRGLTVFDGRVLVVQDNPALPTCEAEALRDLLRAGGWGGDADIWGNDDAGTCE